MTFNEAFNAAREDPRLLPRLDAMWHAYTPDPPAHLDEARAVVVDLLRQNPALGMRYARMWFDANNRL